MEKFELYMQLAKKSEKENKFLIAYALYVEATYRSVGSRKNLIESLMLDLEKRISKDVIEKNRELKEQLMDWVQTGEIQQAICCYSNILERLEGIDWIDSDNAILYQCLSIYQTELNHEIKPWDIAGKNFEELEAWYYKLKFMVRRIDMNVSVDEEFIEFIRKNQISMVALYYMGVTSCFFQERIWKYMIYVFEKYSMVEYRDFFQQFYTRVEDKVPVNVKGKEGTAYGEAENIAFIMAVNQEDMLQEAVHYIEYLKVPSNMKIEVVPIRGASSLTEAYNKGMEMTEAKYKVYLHQDVMIVNPYMIYEVIEIFKNKDIGMIGVAGVTPMPKSGIWWDNDGTGDYRKLYQDTIMERGYTLQNEFEEAYKVVDAIDGVLMVTQYDIPWREDILKGFHFYDISQCMEFKKKNYKVVVAKQENVWCLHEQKWNKRFEKDYLSLRAVFLEEYWEVM